jgi:outer membrane lipoprotein-sorting protein
MKKRSFLALGLTMLAVLLSGCTDAIRAKFSANGSSAHITCYSGTMVIFDGESTGKVQSSSNSDGYYFVDKADGKLKEVSGNCVVEYKE